jgi:hypothetical protein
VAFIRRRFLHQLHHRSGNWELQARRVRDLDAFVCCRSCDRCYCPAD